MKQTEALTEMAHHHQLELDLDHHQLIDGDDRRFERRRTSSPKSDQNDAEKSVAEQRSPSISSSSSSSSSNFEEKKGLAFAEDSGKEEKEVSRWRELSSEDNGRERLKRHRIEMAGRVWIPDIWGQEDLLKDWIDCNAFDACLVPNGIMSARASLVEEGRRATSQGLRIENRC
ncbi:protein BIC1-like [Humulus lupulus]|uniref:protein BIC1-like n=1 Tax=Humulus lupulus TaxID=3486 RepID=UPI002B410F0B|nr:protein BIC1-like [Humulus lupulus]